MILSSEMHRPSSAKLWQMPQPPTVLPSVPGELRRTVPLLEQDTSYLADSASILSLARTFSFISSTGIFSPKIRIVFETDKCFLIIYIKLDIPFEAFVVTLQPIKKNR